MADLKPCPWCGEEPQRSVSMSAGRCYVSCNNYRSCNARPEVVGVTPGQADHIWNTRAAPAPQGETK